MAYTSSDIKQLREMTAAGFVDCKKALEETNGNIEEAVTFLRKKGLSKAAKKTGKVATEGIVKSYIHMNGKIGVLVELNCETDFVAKNEDFLKLAEDISLHIAAMNPKYVKNEDVPQEVIEKEKEIYSAQLSESDKKKPQNIIEKILEGKVSKFYEENCLLNQKFVKDDSRTVQQMITDKISTIGENILVRRFTRYEVGEGIEKKETDFAAEVMKELGKE
jgi:elongation factor Ts